MGEKELIIMLDLSGSMKELGRIAVLKACFIAIRRICPNAKIYGWNNKVFPIRKPKEILVSGKSDVQALVEFFQQHSLAMVFFITDGLIETTEADVIAQAASGRLIAIGLGIDANIAILNKIAGNTKKVENLVDIPELLDIWRAI